MMEAMTKLMLAGMGALSMSRERAEKLFDECVRRGETEKESRGKFIKELMGAATQARKNTEKFVTERVGRAVAKMDLARRQDLARLEKKLDRLLKQD